MGRPGICRAVTSPIASTWAISTAATGRTPSSRPATAATPITSTPFTTARTRSGRRGCSPGSLHAELDPVAAGRLRPVAGGVRGGDEGQGVDVQGVGGGHPEAQGDRQAAARELEGGEPNPRADLLADFRSAVGAAVGEDDQELLPAEAADGIVGADRGAEAAGDLQEGEVAGQVAVGVVDPLEVVDVRH